MVTIIMLNNDDVHDVSDDFGDGRVGGGVDGDDSSHAKNNSNSLCGCHH